MHNHHSLSAAKPAKFVTVKNIFSPRGLLCAGLILIAVNFRSFCEQFAGVLPSFTSAQEGLSRIKLPPGFQIEIFVEGIKDARSMSLSPGGVLYVGTREQGKVYAVLPEKAGKKEIITLASGLNSPNGVAFKDGALYVAEIHRVLKFDNIESKLGNSPSYTVLKGDLPTDKSHGWKFIAFGPEGKLYVPIGMPCNICEKEDQKYGTITRMNAGGSGMEIFARGVRNTVGFDWHPATKELWFTDNGRDWMGEDQPPDELNHAPSKGLHFGFPYCHGKNLRDAEFGKKDCADFTAPALELGPHVAALGMRFYTGAMFPEKYRNGIFIAEHGSWNRTKPIGYRVMFVNMKNNEPETYGVFAEGWLQRANAWGRPVDVLIMPDGALLISDDKAGAIYRVIYNEPQQINH